MVKNNRADRRQYITMCGLPASGKSTLVDIILRLVTTQIGLCVLSTDAVIEQRAIETGKTYNDVFQDTIKEATMIVNEAKQDAFKNMHHIIHDQTNLTVKKRKQILAEVPENYLKSIIYFETDEQYRQQRLKTRGKIIPPSVDENMRNNYVRPARSEGWDHVLPAGDVLSYCEFRAAHRRSETIAEMVFNMHRDFGR